MSGINNLRYNSLQTGTALGGTARYNGNISQMLWDTGTPAGYGFKYDSLNRIMSAKYADGTGYNSNVNLFNTSYTYDKNGNFITHNRFLNGIRVDSLYYTYQSSGNRLQSVTDRSLNYQGYNAVSGNYAYDSNGNMTYDVSKGFTITYNQLNLPQQISCVNDYAMYTWDAAGNKLAKKVYGYTAGNTTRYDYSGNFLYENSVLKCIFTSEGRIVPFNNNGSVLWNYEYNLKDHLGNTRVVFTAHSHGKPETNQITSYDPFGFVTTQTNWYPTGAFKNKFLYNGKELQDDQLAGVKVDWYDYGARMYDPALGRWHSIDPLAEKYYSISPFVYCFNNPIRFFDPDGRSATNYEDEKGKRLLTTNDGNNSTITVKKDQMEKFKNSVHEMAFNRKLDDKQSNVNLIDAVTTATDGVFFTNSQMAWMYMSNNTIENIGWTVNGGVVVEPTEGVGILEGEYTKNGSSGSDFYLQQQKKGSSLFVTLNGKDYGVNSFVHDHPYKKGGMNDNSNVFSGYDKNIPNGSYKGDLNIYQSYRDKGYLFNMYLIGPTDVVKYSPQKTNTIVGKTSDLINGLNLIK